MGYQFANYATGRLATELDGAENTVTLVDGGELFPVASGSNIYQAVLENVSGEIEVVTVTNHVLDTNVFTIVRAQEDTIALTFPPGTVFELRLTRDVLRNFLQLTGGTMTGPLIMDDNEIHTAVIVAPVIEGGTLQGVTLQDSEGNTVNEIFIPDGGGPTIGGNLILHAGNIDDFDGIIRDTRQVLTEANSGLAGGGDLSDDRSLSLDIDNLTPMSDVPAYHDKLAVYRTTNEDHRSVDAELIFGLAVRVLSAVADHTLERSDAGLLLEFDTPNNRQLVIPPNASVPFPVGTLIPVRRRGTGTVSILAGSGVTIESPQNHLNIGARYGMVMLYKRATNIWALEGRLST